MDIKTFCKRFMLWTAIFTAVVVLICGLCFGKVIEENLFAEIAKWVVMTGVIIVIMEVFAYTLSQFFYHGSKWDPDSGKYAVLLEESNVILCQENSNSLHLDNSYLVSKVVFSAVLDRIQMTYPECPIWATRSMASLRREWATHNLAYALGFKRERTADTDFDFELKWYMKLAYFIVGSIALVFIR